ncbi:hypothetical protein K3725_09770 [Leisingera sp. S132]|uniref:hypothetical protein n=1 Tax=Leisingera sp. S132 TaxID=2867016 RepID=UPI0021A27645|nr:hypothetical protein [Leisingera sp. S132]UWQ77610.1 hypothetical protein K3725_09770 [Leisingera sp. S132]
MSQGVKMVALQSRTAAQSPTGKALRPGDPYEVPEQAAGAEERRGLGKRADGKVKDKA